MVTPVFFDTSVLLGGYIDFGESSIQAQKTLDYVAERTIADARTAWHCCLEFYAVATRLPAGYRLAPSQACRLLREIIATFRVEQLPGNARLSFIEEAAMESAAGGRIYDAHIAAIARLAGAEIVVTDNRRHFSILMKHGIRIMRPAELLELL